MRRSVPLVGFVVVMLVASAGVAFGSHDFSDVPDDHQFHDDIDWLASTGITTGFSDGTFRPGQAVTRGSMAAFLRRLAGDDPSVPRMVDAAELGGRTPADFDNAVSLQGRTPADFDDAVTLAGRTPADFDDAVTLGGENALGLLPEVGSGTNTSVTVTGTNSGNATPVASAVLAGTGNKVVLFTAIVDTTHDSLLLTCINPSQVPSAIPGLSGIKVGDFTPGFADRFTVAAVFVTSLATSVDIECFAEDKAGSGTVVMVAPRLVTIQGGLPAS